VIRQSIGLDMPMPRRSTATMGWVWNASAPARRARPATASDGRVGPVVKTRGPASLGSDSTGRGPRQCSRSRTRR
jgi:hypothetical protein